MDSDYIAMRGLLITAYLSTPCYGFILKDEGVRGYDKT